MKRTLIACMVGLAAMALSGCEKKAESSITSGEFIVDTLFKVDGCTAYRFYDNGHAVYFTSCPGQSQYEYSENKHTHRQQATTSTKH